MASVVVAAAARAVHPSPPPLARRTAVAWLACAHLAWAAVDAFICLFLASMWLLFWGMATIVIGRFACAEGSAVVTAAYKVVSVTVGITLVLVFPFAGLLTALMMARAQAAAAAAATATGTEATKEPAPEKTPYEAGAAAVWDLLCDSLAFGLLASLAFTLLMAISDLVKGDSPVIGSRRERMGSVIYDVGALGTVMVNCFVACPIMTVRIWRTWRMAKAWGMAGHAL